MAAARSAPAPRTVRRFSGSSAGAVFGDSDFVAAGDEAVEPDDSADGAAEGVTLLLGLGVGEAGADGEV
ncbi:hypothetical protein SGRIM119S_07626 [Streptomyces griseorubiginosus]